MIKKYSVQFEKYGEDAEKLMCSLLRLSDPFCELFPVTTSTGYVSYKHSPEEKEYPATEFWFSVNEAESEVDAVQNAVLTLKDASMEKAFPLQLTVVYDDELVREF